MSRRMGEIARSISLMKALKIIDTKLFDSESLKDLILASLPDDSRMSYIRMEDPIRYATLALAIQRLQRDKIEGCFAEVGVWKGHASKFIHEIAPDRILYLFDTFEGFPSSDLDGRVDSRFQDTSLDVVMKHIGDTRNIRIRKGYFPETAKGLENERFAFVLLDLDLYAPTLSGMEFFYERLNKGGYLFLHDYNNPESDWAVSRATDTFLANKTERIIEIPDAWGSAVIRKL